MKVLKNDAAAALLMGVLIPALLLNTVRIFLDTNDSQEQTLPAEVEAQTEVQTDSDTLVSVIWENGSVSELDLEEYLVGVVLGEMPAGFELEALKAQAVVARTYTLRRQAHAKHDGGAVCTDSNCCQEYCTEADYLANGGTQASVDKVRSAVLQTRSLVLTYGEELIDATYFSSSGGRTEDALAVWGSDIPYLRSTDSPEDAYAEQYMQTVTITTEQFQQSLGVVLDGPSESWIGAVTYTNGGGVDTIVIGGKTYAGTTVRNLLGLRSTAFVMTAVGDHVTITTRGFGHRVGMSQYGAEAMAVSGSTYEEILAHYYQGTVLSQYIDIG